MKLDHYDLILNKFSFNLSNNALKNESFSLNAKDSLPVLLMRHKYHLCES